MYLDKEILLDVFLTDCMNKLGITEIELDLDEMLEITKKLKGKSLLIDATKDGKRYKVHIADKNKKEG